MGELAPTICRLCTNNCGLMVEIEDGRLVRAVGDRDNPLFAGFSCVKGKALPAFQHHPDRLVTSLKRSESGHVPIRVEQAMDEVAERLRSILDERGPRAVAGYIGTHGGINGLTNTFFFALLNAIGTPMIFTPNTIDKPGKAIATAMHGRWMAPAQGWDQIGALLLIGINPLVTYTGFPAGNPGQWLSDRMRAGMELVVIDPRRSDVARRATVHLQPRPGCDGPLLAAMLRVILDEGRIDTGFVADHVHGVDELRRHLAPFDPSEVARYADVPVDDLVRAARLFAGAPRAFAFAGTGPAMSGPGPLVEYLLLNLLTLGGRWLREGESVAAPGTLISRTPPKAQAAPPTPAWGFGEAMRVRGLGNSAAGMPVPALADEILLAGPGQVRALICAGGNPIGAFPNQNKVARAMADLELLVQIDPFMSETAKAAGYVIAPTMGVEVAVSTQFLDFLSHYFPGYGLGAPFAQYAPALIEPPAGSDVIDDWKFFFGIAQRLGLQLQLPRHYGFLSGSVELDMGRSYSTEEMIELVCEDSRVPLDEVKANPHGAYFPSTIVVGPADPGWQGRFDVAAPDMMSDLDGEAVAMRGDAPAPIDDERFAYRLVCRRMTHVFNTSCRDAATDHGRPYNPAFMHPDDLAMLGFAAGDVVRLTSAIDSIPAVVEEDPNLRRGLVSMSFGFGTDRSGDAEVRSIGSNPTRLISDELVFDRYTGQPLMSNVPVAVSAWG